MGVILTRLLKGIISGQNEHTGYQYQGWRETVRLLAGTPDPRPCKLKSLIYRALSNSAWYLRHHLRGLARPSFVAVNLNL